MLARPRLPRFDEKIRSGCSVLRCRPAAGALLVAGAAIIPGCGGDSSSGQAVDEPGAAEPVRAVDVSAAADVVEVNLVATPARVALLGKTRADVWAYQDASARDAVPSIPGPLIEANQGDRVIVHFTNELPEETTIHWHGVRVPPESDGTTVSQMPVAPGGEFTYEFVAEDAGTFWYHPHVRGDVQVELGLYGMLVVRGERDASIEVDADRAFVLDDVKLEATGQLSTTTDALDVMLGRQGNVVLVNGRERPRMNVKIGGRERWRFVNAANGRYFNLRLPGHSFRVIGWDGGLIPKPYEVDTLLITPGERYEVIVEPQGETGGALALQTVYYDRGHNIPDTGPKDILLLDLVEGGAASETPLPETWGSEVDLVPPETATERRLVLKEEDHGGDDVRFFINDAAFPNVPPLEATSSDVEVWAVTNDTEMDHPFHLHGMFFRVLDVDGVPPEHEGWKDTVNVPQKKVLRFAVQYGAPGSWMYHCHILEHAERGMMGELRLAPHQD
ncbi:MAG TPA: multicopper oxidase family protein [Polyangiaceae bacterium]